MPDRTDIKNHKVMGLDKNKRERIINAAMVEFCKGYKNASTDTIVKEAGISKGLLFHYFGTKEKLYDFLIWYAYDIMISEYFSLINENQKDILESIWQITLLKLDLSYKFPSIFDFIASAYLHTKDDPGNEFHMQLKTIQTEFMSNAFNNYDTTLFKDGIDAQRAVNIIMWTLKGYADSIIVTDKSIAYYQQEYEKYLAETKEYFDIFKKSFYK